MDRSKQPLRHDCHYALTLVDYYSKWPEVAFTPTITTNAVIQFLATVFSKHGNCLDIVSDNGAQFTAAAFTAFLNERDITHSKSSVYYPHANGAVERFNRVLKDCIESANQERKPWERYVLDFLQNYRATPHATMQSTCHSSLTALLQVTSPNLSHLHLPTALYQLIAHSLYLGPQ